MPQPGNQTSNSFFDPPSMAAAVSITTGVALPLMLVFLGLRVYTRLKFAHAGFSADDYLCVRSTDHDLDRTCRHSDFLWFFPDRILGSLRFGLSSLELLCRLREHEGCKSPRGLWFCVRSIYHIHPIIFNPVPKHFGQAKAKYQHCFPHGSAVSFV
ncbi:hypothetical protein F4809DRAFT_596921 [Biscogniauxia mediterranea]|nr:hypothetical protein F4809DRAFT_596921 [Biscogniauxia mediterranea]